MVLHKLNEKLFNFDVGIPNENEDFAIFSTSSTQRESYDYLIFTDSKGMFLDDEKKKLTWPYKIAEELALVKKSVLLISRPKEITAFFTLLNFLNSNTIIYEQLITNLGFVEFTPKKKIFLNDLYLQAKEAQFQDQMLINKFQPYRLSNGKTEDLYAYSFGGVPGKIAQKIDQYFKSCIFIEILEFDYKLTIQRERPVEFFDQLPLSNEFVKKIVGASMKSEFLLISEELMPRDVTISYDAVHFTELGHQRLFEIIFEKLKLVQSNLGKTDLISQKNIL